MTDGSPPMPPTYLPGTHRLSTKNGKKPCLQLLKVVEDSIKCPSVRKSRSIASLLKPVLLISDADRSLVGTPYVSGAAVVATAVKQARGEKLTVFRYKPKKRFRHKRGHRQELTILSIEDILSEGKSLITGQEPQATTSPDEGVATSIDADTVAPVDEVTGEESERRIRRRHTTDTAESTEE